MKTITVLTLLASTLLMGTPAFADHHGARKGHDKPCEMMLGKDGKPMMKDGKPCPMMKNHAGHGGGHMMDVKGDTGASSSAYRKANDVMHRDMNITFSGDSDIDFLRGMIPHHQGAIDMAEVVLEHGTDPQVKRLAREVIRAQNAEIHFMNVRLKQLEQTRGMVHEPVNSRAVRGEHGRFHDRKWAGETWMGQE